MMTKVDNTLVIYMLGNCLQTYLLQQLSVDFLSLKLVDLQILLFVSLESRKDICVLPVIRHFSQLTWLLKYYFSCNCRIFVCRLLTSEMYFCLQRCKKNIKKNKIVIMEVSESVSIISETETTSTGVLLA